MGDNTSYYGEIHVLPFMALAVGGVGLGIRSNRDLVELPGDGRVRSIEFATSNPRAAASRTTGAKRDNLASL